MTPTMANLLAQHFADAMRRYVAYMVPWYDENGDIVDSGEYLPSS